MTSPKRWAALLQELEGNSYLEVHQLASKLGASPATIRRDLGRLQSEGYVTRTHGGAVRSEGGTTLEIPYDIKRQRRIEQKRRIAAAAVEMISNGDTLILDAGSTTFELALLLARKRNLTVVTNDLKIAAKLASNVNARVVCTGGIARPGVFSLQGPQAQTFLHSVRVNRTFLGADAIHPDGTLSNVILEEVPIKQAMIQAAQQVILLADSSKFAVTGFAEVAPISAVHTLITDSDVPEATRVWLAEQPVQLMVV